jgi:hypothetical protein
VNRAQSLRKKATLPSEFCGGICEIEILQVTNFDANIRSSRTCSIFIARLQNSRSNWMVGDIIIGQAEVAMEHAQHFSLTTESSCCDFGIIKFAGSLIAFCKQSGSLLRSAREKSSPQSSPFAKGEANSSNHLNQNCLQ